jgi:hypothetical protein
MTYYEGARVQVYTHSAVAQTITYTASTLLAILVVPALACDILRQPDLHGRALVTLILLLTLVLLGIVCVTVGRRYLLTDEVLAWSILGRTKAVRWAEVVTVTRVERRGGEGLRITDRRGRTIEVLFFSALQNEAQLYQEIMSRTAHAQWRSRRWL